jgi:hypothetical protein
MSYSSTDCLLVLIDVHNPFPMIFTVDHGQEQFYYKEAADKAKEATVFVAQGIPVQMQGAAEE